MYMPDFMVNYWESEKNWCSHKDALWDYLSEILGEKNISNEPNTEDEIAKYQYGTDWYDSSLELYGVPDDFILTEEQMSKLKCLGFLRVFINKQNKTCDLCNLSDLRYYQGGAGYKDYGYPDGML